MPTEGLPVLEEDEQTGQKEDEAESQEEEKKEGEEEVICPVRPAAACLSVCMPASLQVVIC
jgi:hypothetical protein